MKKRIALVIAIVLTLAVVLPVVAACDKKTVEKIEVVNPQTEFYVNDAIDYDSLQIKVTYSDGTTDTSTVAQLKATVTPANLSREGASSYTISYQGKYQTVNITVSIKGNDEPPAPTVEYTVTFDFNDGETDSQYVKVAEGATVSLPQVSDRYGYKFDGWYTQESGGTLWTDQTPVTTNVTLYAHWTQLDMYTVTFVNGSVPVGSATVPAGSTVPADKIPTLQRSGYNFEGWFTQNGASDNWGEQWQTNSAISGDLFVYARWSKIYVEVTVTFDYNDDGATVSASRKMEQGDYLAATQLPVAPARSGYRFDGWYTQQSGGDLFVGAEINQDTTLYAHWVQLVTVTFDLNYDNADQPAPQIIDVNTAPALTVPQRPASENNTWTFDGWWTTPQQDGEQWTEGKTASGDITLYARWKAVAIPVTVTFQADPGALPQGQNEQVTLDKGTALSVLPTPTREGYNFDGWWTTPQQDGEQWSTDKTVTQDTTLYARWTIKQFTVTFDYNHDGITADKTADWNTTVDLPQAEWYGYTFDGWYTDKAQGERLDGSATPAVTADVTYYAHWTAKDTVIVTFVYQDNKTENKTQTVVVGDCIELPVPEERTGYQFVGWFTLSGEGGEQWTTDKPVTETQTLYAHWEKITERVTVTFKYNDGVTADYEMHVNKGSTIAVLPAAPARNGFDFEGWFTQDGSQNGEWGTQWTTETTVTGDVTLYAKWTESTDKITPLVFEGADFYSVNYKQRSTAQGDSLGYFSELNRPYEVGNVNKFIFRPSVQYFEDGVRKIQYNAFTTAKVYRNDGSGYVELTGSELTDYVTVGTGANVNTYLFNKESAHGGDKVKLEISIDPAHYDLSRLEESNRTLTVEFVIVDGGYNVYDQRGLSVMNDLMAPVWAPLWGCEYKDNQLVAGANPVQLVADDKPLYTYVGNVKWVVLHNDIDLDPTQMPQQFFWQTSDLDWTLAYDSLSSAPNQQANLAGTLKDGTNNGTPFYAKQLLGADNEESFKAYITNQLGFDITHQKAFYSTSQVSVSGNYNSITHILENGGRKLQSYADYETNTNPTDPIPHWSIFQMIQSNGADSKAPKVESFEIKNLAAKGSTPEKDWYENGKIEYFQPAGIMMLNVYTKGTVTCDNINANQFFNAIVGDNYDPNNVVTQYFVKNSKIYDAYSNMIYTWRGHFTVENSQLVGAGGPLFILCDGTRNDSTDKANTTDDGGPSLDVDTASRLEAYATGGESWFAANNATALVTQVKGLDAVINKLGKTIRYVKSGDGVAPWSGKTESSEYINIIAAIICDPGNLMRGDNNNLVDIRGTYKRGNNAFAMHNPALCAWRSLDLDAFEYSQYSVKFDAKKFAPILQYGDQYVITNTTTEPVSLYDGAALATALQAPNPQGVLGALTGGYTTAWNSPSLAQYDQLCLYMSAGPISTSPNAPYFGIILDIADYAPQS